MEEVGAGSPAGFRTAGGEECLGGAREAPGRESHLKVSRGKVTEDGKEGRRWCYVAGGQGAWIQGDIKDLFCHNGQLHLK